MCAQDVQMTRTVNSIGKTAQTLRLERIQSISLTKRPVALKKIIEHATIHHLF
jgi:hypothetical protein